MLEENYCFDAEVYADDLDLDKEQVFREDQRSQFSAVNARHLLANICSQSIWGSGCCAICFRNWLMRRSLVTKPIGVLFGLINLLAQVS